MHANALRPDHETIPMQPDDPIRTIAALTAIAQTMLPELYAGGAREFDEAVRDDEPLALAIGNTLCADAIAEGFAWSGASPRSPDAELGAIPAAAFISAAQRLRARVMFVSHDAADAAHAMALGPPGAPRRDVASVLGLAAGHFADAMTRDARSHGADVVETAPAASVEARIAALPEPWRSRTRRDLERLIEWVRTSLEHDDER